MVKYELLNNFLNVISAGFSTHGNTITIKSLLEALNFFGLINIGFTAAIIGFFAGLYYKISDDSTVRHCHHPNCTKYVSKNALIFTTDLNYNVTNLKEDLPYKLKLNFKEVNGYFKINAFPTPIAGTGKVVLENHLSKKTKMAFNKYWHFDFKTFRPAYRFVSMNYCKNCKRSDALVWAKFYTFYKGCRTDMDGRKNVNFVRLVNLRLDDPTLSAKRDRDEGIRLTLASKECERIYENAVKYNTYDYSTRTYKSEYDF